MEEETYVIKYTEGNRTNALISLYNQINEELEELGINPKEVLF